MRVQAGAQMAGIEAGQISEDRHAVEAANCRHAVHGSLSPCVLHSLTVGSPVHRGSALVHLSNLVALAGVEENALGGGGLVVVVGAQEPVRRLCLGQMLATEPTTKCPLTLPFQHRCAP